MKERKRDGEEALPRDWRLLKQSGPQWLFFCLDPLMLSTRRLAWVYASVFACSPVYWMQGLMSLGMTNI